MNAAEQRRHTTNLQMLEKATEQALSEMELDLRDFVREQVGEERTHRLKLADEQRAYVDEQDTKLHRLIDFEEHRRIQLIESLTRGRFRDRLKWLFTGQLPL